MISIEIKRYTTAQNTAKDKNSGCYRQCIFRKKLDKRADLFVDKLDKEYDCWRQNSFAHGYDFSSVRKNKPGPNYRG